MKIILSLVLLILLLAVPSQVLAVCVDPTKTDLSGVCLSSDPIGFASDLYGYGLGLIGGVAVLFVMYGGFVILSSQGDPARLAKGKQYIFFSIVGIILAVSGLAVYQLIGGDILKIPGFS